MPLSVSGLAKVAIFTTNIDPENQCLINHKCVCGELNRYFCQTCVWCRRSCQTKDIMKLSCHLIVFDVGVNSFVWWCLLGQFYKIIQLCKISSSITKSSGTFKFYKYSLASSAFWSSIWAFLILNSSFRLFTTTK